MTWKTNGSLWRRPSGHKGNQDCGGSGCHSARDKLAVRPRATVSTTATTTKPATGVGAAPRAGSTAASAPFNHATVAGTACVSCHSTASGAGKPPTHIVTTDTCQSCHTTLAWLPVRTVDHTQVKGTCASCHKIGRASCRERVEIAEER